MKKLVNFIEALKENYRYSIKSNKTNISAELEELIHRFIFKTYPKIESKKYVFIRTQIDYGIKLHRSEFDLDISIDSSLLKQLEDFYPEEMI